VGCMTHELTPSSEADGGPEHTDRLWPAEDVPTADGPDDLPPIDRVLLPGPTEKAALGMDPGVIPPIPEVGDDG
jgi:hypothetical protein